MNANLTQTPHEDGLDHRCVRTIFARMKWPVFPDTLLLLATSPLLVLQALLLAPKITRLPEPDGARTGVTGDGPRLDLLVLGDSSAAGVGAGSQSDALASQLASHLGHDHRVSWQLCAKSGATSADAHDLLAGCQGNNLDLVYVIFGVNDVKNLRRGAAWTRDMTALVRHLRKTYGNPLIVLSGLPPVGEFPLLPRPMRDILGMRARRFDDLLQDVAIREGCHHVPVDASLDAGGMAPDGFHPGPAIYARWAKLAAQRFAVMLDSANRG